MITSGVVKPLGQVCRKKNNKSGQEEQYLLAAKPGRGSVSLDRRGRGTEKKGKKEWSRGIDPLATQLERSPTARSSWGQVRPNKKAEAKENRQMGWRVGTELLMWD